MLELFYAFNPFKDTFHLEGGFFEFQGFTQERPPLVFPTLFYKIIECESAVRAFVKRDGKDFGFEGDS